MVALTKYTALLNPASPKATVAFGLNAKARAATETLFELANRCDQSARNAISDGCDAISLTWQMPCVPTDGHVL